MTETDQTTEAAALLALLERSSTTWRVVTERVEACGSALAVLRQVAGAQPTLFSSGPDAIDLSDVRARIATWAQEGIVLRTILDADYPENLRTVYDRPPLVFTTGAINERDARSVAVVGTRKASLEGRMRARRLSRHLVANDYTVISGLAAGIDTEAHIAALEAGGRTVAVIGTGLRRCYPKNNTALQAHIADAGAVVSQFLPDAPPTRHSFPMRNAVMSGIALATVVVEAGPNSGARVQARLALAHGRPVFLLRSLLKEAWAREIQQRPGVYVADEPAQITDTIERLSTPELLTA